AFMEWKRNCYDRLNAMWVRPNGNGGEAFVATYDDFKREIANFGGKDYGSTIVPESTTIWANDKPHRQKPQTAFQLSWTAREARMADGVAVLGIERCVWGEMQKL